jgi:hypothetical protein
MRWIRDHIFSRASSLKEKLSVSIRGSCVLSSIFQRFLFGSLLTFPLRIPPKRVQCSLLFPDTLSDSVETVAANGTHCDQVVGRAEAANGQVAAVLHGLVAAGRRHILRHIGGMELGGALVYGFRWVWCK